MVLKVPLKSIVIFSVLSFVVGLSVGMFVMYPAHFQAYLRENYGVGSLSELNRILSPHLQLRENFSLNEIVLFSSQTALVALLISTRFWKNDKHRLSRKILLAVVFVGFLGGCFSGDRVSLVSAQTATYVVNPEGAFAKDFSYLIYTLNGNYYAVDGLYGTTPYKGTDAAPIQSAINAISTGRIVLKDGLYSLGSTQLTVKANIKIEGESITGTILDYTGSDVALKGTDLDFFKLKRLTVKIGPSALGCLLIGAGTTFATIEDVRFLGTDKTVTDQYGIRFDAGDTWNYYNRIVNCHFQTLNKGIVTLSSGAGKANGQIIIDPRFYDIGAVGIDFSPDQSGEHTVLAGWWASSANAIGFKSDGFANHFKGCQLEMGTGAKSFELGNNSLYNVVDINDNNPIDSVDLGRRNLILNNGRLESKIKDLLITREKAWLYDDFYGDTLGSLWSLVVSETGSGGLIDFDGGVYRLETGTTVNSLASLRWTVRQFSVGKKLSFEVRLKPSDTNYLIIEICLYYDADNYIMARAVTYDASTPNYRLITRSGGVSTEIDSGVAVTTEWTRITLRCSADKVDLLIDGVVEATSETNIPTQLLSPRINIWNTASTNRTLDVDYMIAEQTR